MKKNYFTGKNVIITGSSRGIGKELAKQLLNLGANVLINGRNKKRLEKTKKEFQKITKNIESISGDVTSVIDTKKIINKCIDSFGSIDILINNAGMSNRGNFEDLDPIVFEKMMKINFLGSVYCTLAAIPYLKQSKGQIMFISSIAGLRGLPFISAYSAAKMSLTSIAQTLSVELHGTGVDVGISYIGYTENEPNKKTIGTNGKPITLNIRSKKLAQSRKYVVKKIINAIKKRKFQIVLSVTGKFTYFMNRFFPRFLNYMFKIFKDKFVKFTK